MLLCSCLALSMLSISLPGEDWPEWRGAQREGVWREEGIVDRLPPEGLPVRWRAPVGRGFCGPAVAEGRVYLMDRSVDQAADSDVKTQWNHRDRTQGVERVLALDAATGRLLWSHAYPCVYSVSYGSGPRATPTVRGDKLYTLGAMGDVLCLEAATGRVLWQKNLVADYGAEVPLYGYAGAPLVDGDRLIVVVGGEGRAVVAFDRHTGRELWKAGSCSEPGYSAPLLRTLGGRRQILVWHADGFLGLEPESGRTLWTLSYPARIGMAITTPAIEGNRLAVSSQYEGVSLFEFPPGAAEPTVLWNASAGTVPEREWKPSGFNTTLSSVLLIDNHVYGVSLYGETCCLDGATGRRVWTTLQPTSGGSEPRERWSTLFMVRHGDRVVIFNEKGDLIFARLTRAGYEELSRTHLLDPDMLSAGKNGRPVVWSHPAFAYRCVFVRNDHELVCLSLAKP